MKKRIFSLALASTLVLGSASALADSVANVPFVNGYAVEGEELNEFRPDSEVKRCEIAKIAAEAYSIAKADPNFPDVDADHWAAQFIGGLQAAKVVEGDPDGNFRPEDSLTRAEFSAIVKRAAGDKLTDKEEEKDFNDTEGHWAEGIIDDLSKAEVVKGYEDGSFKPENKVTRAEAVAMVLRSLGRSIDPDIAQKVENPFSDVKDGAWYLNDVLGAATEYDYETEKDGKENIPVAVDTKVISSVQVPSQAFEKDSDKKLKLKVNGSSEYYDLAQASANGYRIEFVQLNDAGKEETDNTKFILDNGGAASKNLDGKLIKAKKLGDYTIEARVYKDLGGGKLEFVTSGKGTVTIVDKIAEKTEAVKEVEYKTVVTPPKTPVTVKNDTIVVNETVQISKLIVDIDGKTDVDISGDGLAYELESSNENILEVNKTNNTITGKSVGKATLTVKVGSVTKDVEITVAKDDRLPTKAEVTGDVKIAGAGVSQTVKVKVLDQYGDEIQTADYGLVSAEEDSDVISLDGTGASTVVLNPATAGELQIDSEKEGEATIYFTALNADGEKQQIGSVKVTVGSKVGDTSVSVESANGQPFELDSKDNFDFKVVDRDENGQLVKELTATTDYTAKSSNTDIFTVTGDKTINAVKDGEADLIVEDLRDNKIYTQKVVVSGVEANKEVVSVTYKESPLTETSATSVKLNEFLDADGIEASNTIGEIEMVTTANQATDYTAQAVGDLMIKGTKTQVGSVVVTVDGTGVALNDGFKTDLTLTAGTQNTINITVNNMKPEAVNPQAFVVTQK